MTQRRSHLQALMESVRCRSLSNGNITVFPHWRGVRKYTIEDGGGPGLLTRLAGAARLEKLINAHLKGKRK